MLLHVAGGTKYTFRDSTRMTSQADAQACVPYGMLTVPKTLFDCLQRKSQHQGWASTQMHGTWKEVELCGINQISVWLPSLSPLG